MKKALYGELSVIGLPGSESFVQQVDRYLSRHLAELSKESSAALAAGRYQKFRRMGAAPQKEEA